MNQAGLWTTTATTWVSQYEGNPVPDIWQWLQFIHLPLRQLETNWTPTFLAPVLARHINSRPELQDFLQLVIELDSMLPTIQKS